MPTPRFQGRKFYTHAAHRSVGVSGGFSQRLEDLTGTLAWDRQAKSTRRVCLASASPLDDSLTVLAAIGAWLEEGGVAQCEPASWAEGEEASLKNLQSCDRALFLAEGAALDQPPPDALRAFVASGKPMVIIGRGADRFLAWIRGQRMATPSVDDQESTQIEVIPSPAADGHALLRGVGPFTSQGVLNQPAAASDGATVLLTGLSRGRQAPVAWLDTASPAGVFVTTLGVAADLRIAEFRHLLSNALGEQ